MTIVCSADMYRMLYTLCGYTVSDMKFLTVASFSPIPLNTSQTRLFQIPFLSEARGNVAAIYLAFMSLSCSFFRLTPFPGPVLFFLFISVPFRFCRRLDSSPFKLVLYPVLKV